MKNLARFTGLAALALLPSLAFAADVVVGANSNGGWFFGIGSGGTLSSALCANTICMVASEAIYLINYVLVPVIFAIAFIVFLYGVARAFIFSYGEPDKVSEGRQLILWGIIGFAVMVSVWGLVNVVSNTLGLAGYGHPIYPTSY